MNHWAEILRAALGHGSWMALPFAVLGGVVTGLNPCCLPLYPAAAATCCTARDETIRRSFGTAAAFVIGLAVSTTLLGILAAVAGRVMTGFTGLLRYTIALIPLAIGCQLLGWIRLPMPMTSMGSMRNSMPGAFASGLLLSLVLVPCGTPVLLAVLSFAAIQGNVPMGGLLLFLYGLGAGLPFLVVGPAANRFANRLAARTWGRWVDVGIGALFIGIGLYLIWTA